MKILTGIKPSGELHLGNYVSTIKTFQNISSDDICYFFIADMHSLTKYQKPNELKNNIIQISAILYSYFGENFKIYRQSQIPEIFELNYILNCICPKGFLNRIHSYKAAVEENITNNKDQDDGINMGLYTYPTLMAADILIFEPDFVPVGKDQLQHLEITNELARKFNNLYKNKIFNYSKPLLNENEEVLTGTDGRKMSKSYKNVIPLFGDINKIKKIVFSIATNSKNIGIPKYESDSNLTSLYKGISNKEEYIDLIQKMESGIGWGEVKSIVYEKILQLTEKQRTLYNNIVNNFDNYDKIYLYERDLKCEASQKLEQIKKVIGII